MSPEVAAALARVKEAFAEYPKPVHVDFCHHCFTAEFMDRLFAVPYDELTAGDLERILFKSFTTWGDWPDLAYYVPRLIELSLSGELVADDMLLSKLLWAARPRDVPDRQNFVRFPMSANERDALFTFYSLRFQSQLAEALHWPFCGVALNEALAFLASFHEPIAPFLHSWKANSNMTAQANLACFMADYLLNNAPRNPVLEMTFIAPPVLPVNQDEISTFFAPEQVATYLADHAEALVLLDDHDRYQVGLAFDWAMQS